MTVIGGRGGRQDDWASPHARAQARAAERLDDPLDADEAAWLEDHLASCQQCSAVAADYAAQRLELRALRDRAPLPPRDLWARTSAAIERESRHRSPRRRSRASTLRPYALLAGALVVAIAVGTLTSSQWPIRDATITPGATSEIAVTTPSPEPAAPTPLAVGPKDVAYVSVEADGSYAITTARIDEVCPSGAIDCESNEVQESRQVIGPLATPETVFASDGKPLVVFGEGDEGSSVVAVVIAVDTSGGGGSDPSASPASTESAEPTPSDEVSSSPPSTESAQPTPSDEVSPPPSDEPSPTPSEPAAATVELAPGFEVVGTTAAYAPDGSAFAFTAKPADGSHGPDIFVWNVDDETARPVTSDHRSVFGSWSDDDIVGSTFQLSRDGRSAQPTAIVVRGSEEPIALPGAGLAWRPAVDPSGENAVYWAGTLVPTSDGTDWRTEDGRLVVGRWGDLETPDSSSAPTSPDESDQPSSRDETTIVEGPLTEWDARWDETGTRLAVWVAEPDDPSVGTLSLYVVDPFDGSIDLDTPPLLDEPALAGFSIDEGRLAWAAPHEDGDDAGRVLILAWNEDDFGQVESAPGDFVLVR